MKISAETFINTSKRQHLTTATAGGSDIKKDLRFKIANPKSKLMWRREQESNLHILTDGSFQDYCNTIMRSLRKAWRIEIYRKLTLKDKSNVLFASFPRLKCFLSSAFTASTPLIPSTAALLAFAINDYVSRIGDPIAFLFAVPNLKA